MKALIRDYTGDPKHPRLVATVRMLGSKAVVISKDDQLKDRIERLSIYLNAKKQAITIYDGVEFIEALPLYFSGYMRAEVARERQMRDVSYDLSDVLISVPEPFSGDRQARPANRDDHEWQLMPEVQESVDVGLRFTRDRFDRIRFGFIPREMEDKWFIFYEDRRSRLHRSWTGICIFELVFEENERGGSTATSLVINRSEDQCHTPEARNCVKQVSLMNDNYFSRRVASTADVTQFRAT